MAMQGIHPTVIQGFSFIVIIFSSFYLVSEKVFNSFFHGIHPRLLFQFLDHQEMEELSAIRHHLGRPPHSETVMTTPISNPWLESFAIKPCLRKWSCTRQ